MIFFIIEIVLGRSELTTAILSTDAKRCELKPGFFSLITPTDVGIKC